MQNQTYYHKSVMCEA